MTSRKRGRSCPPPVADGPHRKKQRLTENGPGQTVHHDPQDLLYLKTDIVRASQRPPMMKTGLAALPPELINQIYDYLHASSSIGDGRPDSRVRTVAAMREVCWKTGDNREKDLYRTVHFWLHPRSIEKLVWISLNFAGQVKELVLEDVLIEPISALEERWKIDPPLTWYDRKQYCTWRKVTDYADLESDRYDMYTSSVEAILRLKNLETFKYHAGFQEKRPSPPTSKIDLYKLLHVDDFDDVGKLFEYRQRIWAQRGSGIIFRTPHGMGTRTKGIDAFHFFFHYASNYLDKLEVMSITTNDNGSPLSPSLILFGIEVSQIFDRIKILEILHFARGTTNYWNFGFSLSNDVKYLCRPAGGAFGRVQVLRLKGASLHIYEAIQLRGLGSKRENCLALPSLKRMELENVILRPSSLKWLYDMKIHVWIHNAVHEAFVPWEVPPPRISTKASVRLTGLHIGSSRVPSRVVKLRDKRIRLGGWQIGAWIIAENRQDARATLECHAASFGMAGSLHSYPAGKIPYLNTHEVDRLIRHEKPFIPRFIVPYNLYTWRPRETCDHKPRRGMGPKLKVRERSPLMKEWPT
ncbi:hypothetical protein BU24DRAFT_497575 [Aaosphaeria arxii CBS 175.79]|uniref:Uncharacterized protein n=1 Tax=Aaosphaeria arxii CBS 175.79 TaxID=1450172 RepID=A0A6A5X871_9PLEO|nr:uncharacterized protein BU24DRAFT_497575 [Aaosphaeria arxii CBS 175.79]KAF2009007.1 hypothetical protein BU24DRAFT_497575 [Aaosphaeria arxii CBS 175.79]